MSAPQSGPPALILLALAMGCSGDSQEAFTDSSREADAGDGDGLDIPLQLSPAEELSLPERVSRASAPGLPPTLVGQHPVRVGDIAWSADGALIATCELGESLPQGGITLWDAHSLQPRARMAPLPDPTPYLGPFEWESCSLDWSPGGDHIYEARVGRDQLRVWNVDRALLEATLTVEDVRSVSVNPDGRSLALSLLGPRTRSSEAALREEVLLFELPLGERRRPLRTPGRVAGAWWSGEGRLLMVPGRQAVVYAFSSGRPARHRARPGEWRLPLHGRGWAPERGRRPRRPGRAPRATTLAVESSDGAYRAAVEAEGFRLTEVESERTHLLPRRGHNWSVQVALALDPRGSVLATVESQAHPRLMNELISEVRLWSVKGGEPLGEGGQPSCQADTLDD